MLLTRCARFAAVCRLRAAFALLTAAALIGLTCPANLVSEADAAAKKGKKKKKKGTPKPDGGTPSDADTAAKAAEAEAKRHFESATLFYESGEYKTAAKEFEAAYELAPSKHKLLYNAAVAWEAGAADERAAELFDRYLEAVPDAPNRAEVTERLKRLRPPPKGDNVRVTLTSHPAGARVWVDLRSGRGGETPYVVSLDPGDHVIFLEKRGYRKLKTTIDIPGERDEVDIDIEMIPLMGYIVVKGRAGAKVLLDGEGVGALPLDDPIEAPIGYHQVTVDGRAHEVEVRERATVRVGGGGGGKTPMAVAVPFLALAVGGGATAVALGLTASARYRELRICTTECPIDFDRAIDNGKRFALIADIGWIAGSAMAAVGVSLLIASGLSGRSGRAASGSELAALGVAPVLVPGGGALTVHGSF